MARHAGARSRPPFLSDGEQAAWDTLRDLLAGRITFPRPDNAEPLTLPECWGEFRLMREMHWSWEQLQATPAAVLADTLRCLDLIAEAQAEQTSPAAAGVPIDITQLPGYTPPAD